jgi:hypothetical protein
MELGGDFLLYAIIGAVFFAARTRSREGPDRLVAGRSVCRRAPRRR